MIKIIYSDRAAEPCKICNTPTFYTYKSVRCCPVCAKTHSESDLGIAEPAGTRSQYGKSIALSYTFKCGHEINTEDMPRTKRGYMIAVTCPICGKGKLDGKTYRCKVCGELFYHAGPNGNPKMCKPCSKINTKKLRRASYERLVERGKKNIGRAPRYKRSPWPELNVLDFMYGQGNWENAKLYNTVDHRDRVNKPKECAV